MSQPLFAYYEVKKKKKMTIVYSSERTFRHEILRIDRIRLSHF